MGRRSTGTIEIRQSCIRLKFTHLGLRQVETLDLKPTPANIKAAERLLAKIQGAIGSGVYRREDFFTAVGKGSLDTFEAYGKAWLRTVVAEKSTLRSYTSALKNSWNPAFGDKPISRILHSDVKAAVATRSKIVSGKTMNNHLIVLRGVFEMALADNLIEKSPVDRIKNLKHQTPEADPFDRDEMDLILQRMKTKFHEQVFNYYDIAFNTGLRPSEQISVRWPDIDWRRSTLTISRAHVEGETKATKTNTIRTVNLNDRAVAALERQRIYTFMKDPQGHVFENPNTNQAWNDERVQRRRYWTPTLSAIGLRHREAYQTRHTFASLLLMGGINPAYIAKQLGHSSLAMVFKVYAKWIDQADKGAEAQKANAVLSIVPELSPKGNFSNK